MISLSKLFEVFKISDRRGGLGVAGDTIRKIQNSNVRFANIQNKKKHYGYEIFVNLDVIRSIFF